ncbi:hypothetical protein IAT40_003881 [Kwoniella sp. CBS 6097]
MFGKTIFATLAALAVVSAAPALEKKDNSGTATYYDAGLGACGWTNSNSDYVVAVNSAQFDQGNCGKQIWIYNGATGKTVSAQAADECPTCNYGDLDLSQGLFGALTNDNYDLGVFDMTWGFE